MISHESTTSTCFSFYLDFFVFFNCLQNKVKTFGKTCHIKEPNVLTLWWFLNLKNTTSGYLKITFIKLAKTITHLFKITHFQVIHVKYFEWKKARNTTKI